MSQKTVAHKFSTTCTWCKTSLKIVNLLNFIPMEFKELLAERLRWTFI